MPELSVVIPTYNRLETLAHVIPTLLAQDLPASDFEVLVCDSNSTDGTAEYLAGVARRASERAPSSRSLFAAARRRATRVSTRRAARSCCSTTPTSSRRPTCSRSICATTARSARSPSWACEVQVKDLDEYAYKRDHPQRARLAAQADAQTVAVALFSHRQRLGAPRGSDARRALRRELHRLRSRGSRTGLPARTRRRDDSLRTATRSTITVKTCRTTIRKRRCVLRDGRRCVSTASIPILRCD